MRLELGIGQWAELRERLSYEAARDVRRVRLAAEEDAKLLAEVDLAYVRAYVEAWSVLDLDGNAVGLDQPEKAPDDIIQRVAKAAMQMWNGKAIPKSIQRDIGLYAQGAAVKFSVDSLLAEVIFLDKHPGWTYRDLLEAPDDLVAGLRLLDQKRA